MDRDGPPENAPRELRKHHDGCDEDLCVICLQVITNKAVAVPCNHLSFCFLCLSTWLKQHQQCPLCKAEVLQVEYDWQSPEDYRVLQICRPKRKNTHRQSSIRPALPRDYAVEARQRVYRNGIASCHIGCNPCSGHHAFTAHDFSKSPVLMRRARVFLRRELRVFPFLNSNTVTQNRNSYRIQRSDYLIEYIVAVLKTNELKGSDGKAEDLVTDFLGRKNAQLLLHELQAWLQSPCETLDDWDRVVQYIGVPK